MGGGGRGDKRTKKESIIGILSNDTAGFELPTRKRGVADERH